MAKIRLIEVSNNPLIFINPNTVVLIERSIVKDYSLITLSTGRTVSINATPESLVDLLSD